MSKNENEINDKVIQDFFKAEGVDLIKAESDICMTPSSIHPVYEGDGSLSDIAHWFTDLSKKHGNEIIYYDFCTFNSEDYFVCIEDLLLDFGYDPDDDESEENERLLSTLCPLAEEYNDYIGQIREGIPLLVDFYFIHNGCPVCYCDRGISIPKFDELLETFYEELFEDFDEDFDEIPYN